MPRAVFTYIASSFASQEGLTMANTPQAKKRIRRNARRTEINGARVSRIRTFVKAVEAALASGDKAQAEEAIRRVQPELMRGVAKGVVHKNTASRKFSRLTKRVAALS
jgi:small subunit ribosomal protein S20